MGTQAHFADSFQANVPMTNEHSCGIEANPDLAADGATRKFPMVRQSPRRRRPDTTPRPRQMHQIRTHPTPTPHLDDHQSE